jgi:prevent-host-death family protein
MKSVSIHEAKTHLSSIIATVERLQEPVIINRHGHAVAELMPIPHGSRLVSDPELKNIRMKEDPTLPTAEEWEDV